MGIKPHIHMQEPADWVWSSRVPLGPASRPLTLQPPRVNKCKSAAASCRETVTSVASCKFTAAVLNPKRTHSARAQKLQLHVLPTSGVWRTFPSLPSLRNALYECWHGDDAAEGEASCDLLRGWTCQRLRQDTPCISGADVHARPWELVNSRAFDCLSWPSSAPTADVIGWFGLSVFSGYMTWICLISTRF